MRTRSHNFTTYVEKIDIIKKMIDQITEMCGC